MKSQVLCLFIALVATLSSVSAALDLPSHLRYGMTVAVDPDVLEAQRAEIMAQREGKRQRRTKAAAYEKLLLQTEETMRGTIKEMRDEKIKKLQTMKRYGTADIGSMMMPPQN